MSASDLGEVGEFVVDGPISMEPDCFLISHQPSPITSGYQNTYDVVFTEGSDAGDLANQIQYVRWIISVKRSGSWVEAANILAGTGSNTQVAEELDSRVKCYKPETLTFVPDCTLPVKIEVQLLTESTGTSLRSLVLEQPVKSPNPDIMNFTEAFGPSSLKNLINIGLFPIDPLPTISFLKDDLEEMSLLGNEQHTQTAVDLLHPHLVNAANTSSTGKEIPTEFLAAFYYSDAVLKKDALNLKAWIFNYHPFVVGKVVGDNGFTGQTYVPLDKALGNSLYQYYCEYDSSFTSEEDIGPDEELRILNQIQDLLFLQQFPKSNIRIAFSLLNKIKNVHLGSMTTEELVSHENEYLVHIATNFNQIKNFPSHKMDLSIVDYSRPASEQLSLQLSKPIPARIVHEPYIQIICSGGIGARSVVASVDSGSGEVTSVNDPFYRGILLPTSHEVEGTEVWQAEHFGWTPAAHIKSSIVQTDKEMVFADAGFWGHYDRANPQRDFLMIEGRHVLLCRLVYESEEVVEGVHSKTQSLLQALELPIAAELAAIVHDPWHYAIEIVSLTEAGSSIAMPTKLTVVFPDMHLPMKWPELPSVLDHHSRGAELRTKLREMQRSGPSYDAFPAVGPWYSERIQLQRYMTEIQGLPWNASSPKLTGDDIGISGCDFTPHQFNTEKALVDRKLSVDSSWFYPPYPQSNPTLDPDALFDGNEPAESSLNGDPAPAVDLVALLMAIKTVQNGGQTVRVIQAGDLFEMWMGREWLYRDFERIPDSVLGSQNRKNDNPISAATLIGLLHFSLGEVTFPDDRYQYRLDSGWKAQIPAYEADDDSFTGASKNLFTFLQESYPIGNSSHVVSDVKPLYVFHSWPIDDLRYRRRTGHNTFLSDTDDVVSRAKGLVEDRVTAIREFSLPKIEYDDSLSRCKALDVLGGTGSNGIQLNSYKKPGISNEYYWNKMVLDSFEKVGCEMVAGNHDGYRSDKWLKKDLSNSIDQAVPWISGDGLWVEHAHRWDEYNRDGVPAGAAVTNLCQYYFRPGMFDLNKVKGQLMPSFLEQTVPGAAQWFLLVNNSPPDTFVGGPSVQSVQPFLVYIVGHSHSPDLFKVKFTSE